MYNFDKQNVRECVGGNGNTETDCFYDSKSCLLTLKAFHVFVITEWPRGVSYLSFITN